MRIQQFILENFRSITHLQLNDIQNLNCFIGAHNSGKTNILTGISVFWDPFIRAKVQKKQLEQKTIPKQDFDTPGSILSYLGNVNSIHGKFKLLLDDKTEILSSWIENSYIRQAFLNIAKSYRINYSVLDFLSEIEKLVDPRSISGFVFDLKLNPESLSYVEEKCFLCLNNGEEIRFNSENLPVILQVIGNIFIRRFQDISFERESLTQNLLKILQDKDYNTISLIEGFLKDILDQEFIFNLGSVGKNIKYGQEVEVTIERAFSSPLWRISSGTTRIIALSYLLTASPMNQIIILDDPGLYLHPKGERALAKKLEKLSKDHQIFLSTHSSRFLIGHAYLVELRKGWTKIRPIRGGKSMKRVVKLLGIRPSDSFGSDVVVFTEGRIDAQVYRVFEDKIKMDSEISKFKRVTYIGVGGWTNIKFALSIELLRSKFVHSKAVAVTDGDIVGSDHYYKIKNNWETVFPKNSFLSLKEECIESLFLNNPIVFIRLSKDLQNKSIPSLDELQKLIALKRNQGVSDKTITMKILEKYLSQEYRSTFAEKLAKCFKREEIPEYIVDFFNQFILS